MEIWLAFAIAFSGAAAFCLSQALLPAPFETRELVRPLQRFLRTLRLRPDPDLIDPYKSGESGLNLEVEPFLSENRLNLRFHEDVLFGNGSKRANSENLRSRLRSAGYATPAAGQTYRLIQVLTGLAAVAVSLAFAALGITGTSLAFAAITGVAGAMIPWFWVSLRRRRRALAVDRGLPRACELMAATMLAGLPLDQAVLRAAHELKWFDPVIGEELCYLGVMLPYLRNRQEADMLVTQNFDSAAWKILVALSWTGKHHGLSLTPTLIALARDLRAKRMARTEEAAAKLGPRLTVPLILFFLPPLLLLLLAPAFMRFAAP